MAPGSPVSDLTRISPRTPCGAPNTPIRMRRSGARKLLVRSGCWSRRGLFCCGRSSRGALLRLLLRLRLLRVVVRFALGEAEAVEQTQHAIGRLRALGEPRLGLLLIEHDAARVILGFQGIEGADLFDKPAIARHTRVRHHNAIESALLCAAAR